jgi:ABC-type antimicrobial peptide transport system ATPase subunit
MSIEVRREIGALLAEQLPGEDATDALIDTLTERGLLDLDLHSQVERARRVAVEMTRRVDLAEQFIRSPRTFISDDAQAELLEILRGDR